MRKRSPLRCLHAIALIRWILAFIDSAGAFVARSTTALRISSRCVRTIRAARTMGSSLLREASAAQAFHAPRAQPISYSHSFAASAHARLVRVHIPLSRDSSDLRPERIDAGLSSHTYSVPTITRSPSARSCLCSSLRTAFAPSPRWRDVEAVKAHLGDSKPPRPMSALPLEAARNGHRPTRSYCRRAPRAPACLPGRSASARTIPVARAHALTQGA